MNQTAYTLIARTVCGWTWQNKYLIFLCLLVQIFLELSSTSLFIGRAIHIFNENDRFVFYIQIQIIFSAYFYFWNTYRNVQTHSPTYLVLTLNFQAFIFKISGMFAFSTSIHWRIRFCEGHLFSLPLNTLKLL